MKLWVSSTAMELSARQRVQTWCTLDMGLAQLLPNLSAGDLSDLTTKAKNFSPTKVSHADLLKILIKTEFLGGFWGIVIPKWNVGS